MSVIQERMKALLKQLEQDDDRKTPIGDAYTAQFSPAAPMKSFVPTLTQLTGNQPETDAQMVRYLSGPGAGYWGNRAARLAAETRAKLGALAAKLSDEVKHENFPTEWYLRSNLLEDILVEKVAPKIIFDQFTRRVVINQDSGTYKRNLYSWADDPLKLDPAQVGHNGEFPDITTTKFVERNFILSRRGFKLTFDFDAIHNNSGFDHIAYDIDRAVNWYSDYLNTRSGVVLTNNWDAGQTGDNAIHVQAASALWSSSSADPVKDIRDIRYTFKNSARLNATDIFVNPDNYRELLDYLDFATQRWAMDPFTNRPTVQIDDITVHEAPVDGGIQASTALVLSRDGMPPLSMYERVYPEFSRSGSVHVVEREIPNLSRQFTFFRKTALVLPDPKKVGMIHTL